MESRAPDPDFVVVGHLSKPHGTKGEFYVWPLTDRPDSTFLPGQTLSIADPEGERPDDVFPALRILSVRPFRKGFLVHFDGIQDRTEADLLRDRYLLRPFAETEPLDEGEVFYHQLLGMDVRTVAGDPVGQIREVYEVRPADLLEVVGAGKVRLVPFTRQVVVEWSAEEGWMVIDPPDGLLDL